MNSPQKKCVFTEFKLSNFHQEDPFRKSGYTLQGRWPVPLIVTTLGKKGAETPLVLLFHIYTKGLNLQNLDSLVLLVLNELDLTFQISCEMTSSDYNRISDDLQLKNTFFEFPLVIAQILEDISSNRAPRKSSILETDGSKFEWVVTENVYSKIFTVLRLKFYKMDKEKEKEFTKYRYLCMKGDIIARERRFQAIKQQLRMKNQRLLRDFVNSEPEVAKEGKEVMAPKTPSPTKRR